MKALLIGGTGTISTAISKDLLTMGHELYLLNRGNRNDSLPEGAKILVGDVADEAGMAKLIGDMKFDVVADFIAFTQDQVERDYRLFAGKTRQYIFISSASAYQKPVSDYRITESTPLANPYWEYSRNKIACEEYLMKMYRETGFPITIIRPSHTYSERSIPMGVHGTKGAWQIIKRMMEGKKVPIQGDGTSLWVMTFNTDFAKAFIGLMGNPRALGQAVQITSDEALTWNQIYQIVADALGVELHAFYVPSEILAKAERFGFEGGLVGDKSNTVVFDNTKLKHLVPGFAATVRFDEGIRKSLAYALAHPELQVEDPDFDTWCDRVAEIMEHAMGEVEKL